MNVKLDENISSRLADVLRSYGHDVDTVQSEGMTGCPDQDAWEVAQSDGRFLVTQDPDFSDMRRFAPGTHAGVLLVRLREPGANAVIQAVSGVADQLGAWGRCFVVLTERKLRVKRPWKCYPVFSWHRSKALELVSSKTSRFVNHRS